MTDPRKHNIEALSVWLDKPAIQQAFTSLAAPIIEAAATAKVYGDEVAGELHGDDGRLYPKAGEVVIGQVGSLTVKLTIEPSAAGGWHGESLTHDEINAIGISNMTIDGQLLTPRKES
ncbi:MULTISPECIES: hypothetical protein [unclassified Halomonas]|uniref:hypothetical protein n=1 Tax=unclassified Halomonas TaxID=2609666 RepID=UPI0020769779|nr:MULTISPECIES: hypothetical protein [unclassified Halomonas]